MLMVWVWNTALTKKGLMLTPLLYPSLLLPQCLQSYIPMYAICKSICENSKTLCTRSFKLIFKFLKLTYLRNRERLISQDSTAAKAGLGPEPRSRN